MRRCACRPWRRGTQLRGSRLLEAGSGKCRQRCALFLDPVALDAWPNPKSHRRRHRVPAEKLAIISKTIPRIAIITGDYDNLINPQRSHDLHRMLPVRTFLPRWLVVRELTRD